MKFILGIYLVFLTTVLVSTKQDVKKIVAENTEPNIVMGNMATSSSMVVMHACNTGGFLKSQYIVSAVIRPEQRKEFNLLAKEKCASVTNK